MLRRGLFLDTPKNKKRFAASKFKAAVYQKTPAPLLPSKPKVLTAAILLEIIALFLLPIWRTYKVAWVLLGASIPIGAWLFMRWRIYASVFITPPRTITNLTNNRWESFLFKGWGNETLKGHILKSESGSKDMILYLHGYNSTLGRGESRCQHMNSMGLNVVSLDQRGFGEQKGKYEWTILKVVADIELLLEQIPEIMGYKPTNFLIYGHSLGGFISIRLSSHPSGWWEKALKGVILESPVTSFPLIIQQNLPGRAIMANPWVRHILRREYQRIHPDLNVGYSNAQIPFWGIPKTPLLVIQAREDETLGSQHFDLLNKHFVDIADVHVVDQMPHTSKVDVLERREILEKWINKMI